MPQGEGSSPVANRAVKHLAASHLASRNGPLNVQRYWASCALAWPPTLGVTAVKSKRCEYAYAGASNQQA
jgi:hypothetical protein